MRSTKRFKCRHCKRISYANPGNGWHQRYCSEPLCRKASKVASQRRWLAKPENRDHFRGPSHVKRVRQWRRKHPGYWKRPAKPRADALQDLARPQVPLLMGLVSVLPGDALQDDVVIFNNDATLASAVLDRLLHHAETVIIEGKSFRMKGQAET